MADIDLDAARALAVHARIDTAARGRLPALIEQLCDALEQCGYDLTGQWAARFPMANWDDDLTIKAGHQQAAREIVRTGREADPRWKLMHRTVGPWVEVDDA